MFFPLSVFALLLEAALVKTALLRTHHHILFCSNSREAEVEVPWNTFINFVKSALGEIQS
jgi:hypothetical protein